MSSDTPTPAKGRAEMGAAELGGSTPPAVITADQNWQNHLDQQIEQQRLRVRRVIERAHDRCLLVDNQLLIDFASNDYLGLSQHPQVIAAAHASLDQWGVGASASQMVCGYRQPQALLEQQLAQWLGVEATLIFSSGYLANMGLMMGVLGRHDVVVADKACHASLLDGIRLKGAKLLRFTHNQVSHAAKLLKNVEAGKRCWLVTESIFSMSGDTAPLAALADLAEQYQARLMVDEAHALGVMGAEGKGVLADLALKDVIITGTFGKAFGTAGAFVGGSQLLIDYLQQTARTCTYSTALPPSIVQATLAALQQLQQQPVLVSQLQQRIREFKSRAHSMGLPLLASDSAIQIIPLGCSERALSLSAALAARGLWIPAIRPPTVPQGHACLRLVLSAQHSDEQMDRLFEQLQQCQASWVKA